MTPSADVVLLLTDQERAAPRYEDEGVDGWRRVALPARCWFAEHGVVFDRHHTGSVACVPSRPTLLTGQYPDVHGATQTDGLGKRADDSRMRWLREGEVPTLGHWFRAGGYDTRYVGKWHLSHADLLDGQGRPIPTNTDDGTLLPDAVRAYLDADPLDPFGFSGWVGPEPHGAPVANSGLVRDPLFADRAVTWLEDRYRRRAAGDGEALRPFLLVVSFVNPHDIVFWPAWSRNGVPLEPAPYDPPDVDPAPTQDEDLSTKPAAQRAYRDAYPTGYGPAGVVKAAYDDRAEDYRRTYLRLHAEVDGPLERVRRAVTDRAGAGTVLVRTADHGELLGAHGGLHQKWFTLYDEAVRVPLEIVVLGRERDPGAGPVRAPTSHVDLVPTLIGLAGLDAGELTGALAGDFTELHPFPGRDLTPLVLDPGARRDGTVYLVTRDNILEGDTLASALAQALGQTADPPEGLRIEVPADVAANVEAVVSVVEDDAASGGGGHAWKLVRYFDDPATWTEPGVRHLSDTRPGGDRFRTEPLADEWELYDLDADAAEARNLAGEESVAAVRQAMLLRLAEERARCLPDRHSPWPYAERTGSVPV